MMARENLPTFSVVAILLLSAILWDSGNAGADRGSAAAAEILSGLVGEAAGLALHRQRAAALGAEAPAGAVLVGAASAVQ